MRPGGPLYERIEFCRNPETLWGKIESRHWDWLGVHPDGQFVLGSPSVHGRPSMAALTVGRAGSVPGQHGIGITVPFAPAISYDWRASPEDARSGYEQTIEEQSDEALGPGLARITLIHHREVVDEHYVVRKPATYR